MKNKDLAIIVLSCDKFSSLWPLFFSRLNKFFPADIDIPVKLYLLSNFCEFKSDCNLEINLIKTGEDISWSCNLRKLLSSVDEENILFFMDDGLLSAPVDKKRFINIYKEFLDKEMNYINLKSSPPANTNLGNYFGELSPGTHYRTSIVPSIWKKSILLKLLRDEENAWQFEIFGSRRSDLYENFFSINEPIFKFDHVVIKGKIDRAIYKKLKLNEEHHELNFPIMTRWEYFLDLSKRLRSFLVKKFVPNFIISSYRTIKYK